MKEAAGEANMTVITIVLIGLVAAVGAVLIPQLLNSSTNSSCCTSSGGVWYQNKCYSANQCDANGACTGSAYTPKCD